jgi:glycosyltransferase involved in cell wall biosynthesis
VHSVLDNTAARLGERISSEAARPDRGKRKPVRLAYVVSHPIQYQAPLLRRIAQEPDIDLTVLFGSDFSVRGYRDEGFGVGIKWDVPLLEGYKHLFLPRLRDGHDVSFATPLNRGISRQLRGKGQPFDALWVHGYATLNSLHAMIAAKALGIPVLLRAESWLRDRGRSPVKLAVKNVFFEGLEKLVDAVLPIGTMNSEYWRYYFGKDVPQFLMPYAVDNDYFSERAKQARSGKAELQAELGLDPGRPVVLFASKLQERKHCNHLIEACADANTCPYLLIVGDGEERTALERQAAATNLPVRFCGFRNQSELPRFFDLASVFVLPSRHEPWGLIVNEAMNAACPAIVSDDVGCGPDLIEDGVNGCIYPVGNINALANAIHRVIADPATAASMGQKARERMQSWGFEQDVTGLRQALASVVPNFIA